MKIREVIITEQVVETSTNAGGKYKKSKSTTRRTEAREYDCNPQIAIPQMQIPDFGNFNHVHAAPQPTPQAAPRLQELPQSIPNRKKKGFWGRFFGGLFK